MFCAPDPVQGLICLPASRSKIKLNVKVFLMIITSYVCMRQLVIMFGIDELSSISKQHTFLRVLDILRPPLLNKESLASIPSVVLIFYQRQL